MYFRLICFARLKQAKLSIVEDAKTIKTESEKLSVYPHLF